MTPEFLNSIERGKANLAAGRARVVAEGGRLHAVLEEVRADIRDRRLEDLPS